MVRPACSRVWERERENFGGRWGMQDSMWFSVNVGMQVQVRANRPDWGRVGSVWRSGLGQAGPGRAWVMVGLWSGPGQISFGSAGPSGVGPDWAEPVVKCAGSESGTKRRSA